MIYSSIHYLPIANGTETDERTNENWKSFTLRAVEVRRESDEMREERGKREERKGERDGKMEAGREEGRQEGGERMWRKG